MSDSAQFDRLRWRCRRGLLELDELLSAFLQHYPDLTASEQAQFERLLEMPDIPLLAYLNGQETAPPEFDNIVRKIRQ